MRGPGGQLCPAALEPLGRREGEKQRQMGAGAGASLGGGMEAGKGGAEAAGRASGRGPRARGEPASVVLHSAWSGSGPRERFVPAPCAWVVSGLGSWDSAWCRTQGNQVGWGPAGIRGPSSAQTDEAKPVQGVRLPRRGRPWCSWPRTDLRPHLSGGQGLCPLAQPRTCRLQLHSLCVAPMSTGGPARVRTWTVPSLTKLRTK